MKSNATITGVSAVNDEGLVIIFCADPGYRYDRYEIEGQEIRLISAAKMAIEPRTYGILTCSAIHAGAPLHIQTILVDGSLGDLYPLED